MAELEEKKAKKILTEASGSLTASWIIKRIQESGHIAVASDVLESCFGKYIADEYILVPKANDLMFEEKMEQLLVEHSIDVVLPSFDETLMFWARKKNEFKIKYGIDILISDIDCVDIFTNKYKTYEFFIENDIPTPKSSKEAIYELIKPIYGRGSSGIFINDFNSKINMEDNISQEVISGQEYTVDCLFNHDGEPIYIVPRRRENVKDGKSLNGIVEINQRINDYILKISNNIKFVGPINIQCFDTGNEIVFIEINPRIAGGMALGIAATENWISLIVDYILMERKDYSVKVIKDGLRMYRYYEEVFI